MGMWEWDKIENENDERLNEWAMRVGGIGNGSNMKEDAMEQR